jgi:hypothetical protein
LRPVERAPLPLEKILAAQVARVSVAEVNDAPRPVFEHEEKGDAPGIDRPQLTAAPAAATDRDDAPSIGTIRAGLFAAARIARRAFCPDEPALNDSERLPHQLTRRRDGAARALHGGWKARPWEIMSVLPRADANGKPIKALCATPL